MDNKKESLNYIAPDMEFISVVVEQGYAGSQLPEREPEIW